MGAKKNPLFFVNTSKTGLSLLLLAAICGFACQDAAVPEPSPYEQEIAIVSSVRRMYEQRPEYELPADTVRLFFAEGLRPVCNTFGRLR